MLKISEFANVVSNRTYDLRPCISAYVLLSFDIGIE